jgi:hypothetical protein
VTVHLPGIALRTIVTAQERSTERKDCAAVGTLLSVTVRPWTPESCSEVAGLPRLDVLPAIVTWRAIATTRVTGPTKILRLSPSTRLPVKDWFVIGAFSTRL